MTVFLVRYKIKETFDGESRILKEKVEYVVTNKREHISNVLRARNDLYGGDDVIIESAIEVNNESVKISDMYLGDFLRFLKK